VGGGGLNIARGLSTVVSGGSDNQALATDSTIGGGYLNRAMAYRSTIAGGHDNFTTATYTTVGGGRSNEAGGDYATVPGGHLNVADGAFGFAAGRRAKALHDGSIVFADSTNADCESTTANEFRVRATVGVHLEPGPAGLWVNADTIIAVPPTVMFQDPDEANAAELRPDTDGTMIVRSTSTGFHYVHVPVTLPSQIYGVPRRFKSVQISYVLANAGSLISYVRVDQTLTNGTRSQIIFDGTDRTSTTWETFAITPGTPQIIDGTLFIRFGINFSGTGAAHDVTIGPIFVTLSE
jgi:hypothetical protein